MSTLSTQLTQLRVFRLILPVALLLLAAAVFAVPMAHASGTVTDCTAYGSVGTAGTLADALAGGGAVTFACNGTIVVPEIVISSDTVLDATGHSVTLSGNNANRVLRVPAGASLTVRHLTIANGNADFGGGIATRGGHLLVERSVIESNRASGGGGILVMYEGAAQGTATIRDSTIRDNTAQAGGGMEIVGSTATIERSTFSGNTATGGTGTNAIAGAISFLASSTGGSLTIRNSTISGNTAVAGTFGESQGGGIFVQATFSDGTGSVQLVHTTIAGNSATHGSGVITNIMSPNATRMRVANTIIADGCDKFSVSVVGIESQGYNVSGDATCSFTQATDQQSTNPLLGALADNGGPTQTRALQTGSPAMDRIPLVDGSCNGTGIKTDQRGYVRPEPSGSNQCDVGAYEVDAGPPVPTRAESALLSCGIEPFDADAGGFRTKGETGPHDAPYTLNGYVFRWESTGGNPDGNLRADDMDDALQEVWTPAFLTTLNFSNLNGKNLRFDYLNGLGTLSPYVAIVGSNGTAYYFYFKDQLGTGTGWRTVTVPMVADQWRTVLNVGTPPATGAPSPAQFAAVLNDLDHIAIGIETYNGGDETAFIDNFGVPCPAGTIRIVKEAQPEGPTVFDFYVAGPVVGTDYTLVDDGSGPNFFETTETPGVYVVTEEAELGWAVQNIVCDDANSFVDVTARKATILLEDGETVTCTFTNVKPGTITIVKEANPSDDTPFTFRQNIDGSGDFTLSDPTTDTAVFLNVLPGPYRVTELAAAAPWELIDITCVETASQNSWGDVTSATATINLEIDESVTCTFTNVQPGTIRIVKEAQPEGPTVFDFYVAGPVVGTDYTLVDDGSGSNFFDTNEAPGVYVVTEEAEPGWTLESIVCDDANSFVDVITRKATILLESAETVTCTYTNVQADFGDAPDTNLQTAGANRAYHTLSAASVHLGANAPDAESNGIPNASANGDDMDNTDDEDGLTGFIGIDPNWSDGGAIQVTVNNVQAGGACVYAWVDWDDDGFGAGSDSKGQVAVAANGAATINFPADANMPGAGSFPASAYLRLRAVDGACGSLAATGGATGGEVEDHVLSFTPNAVEVTSLTARPAGLMEAVAQLWRLLTGR